MARVGDPGRVRLLARVLWSLAIVAGPMIWPGPVLARVDRTVSVRGRITDASGSAVPGHTVRLLKARTIITLKNFQTRGQNVEEVRTTTDSRGFYEFAFPIDKQFRYYYLRFYDPGDFDSVKYRLPADREISRRARRGRPVRADIVLEMTLDWPEVKGLIDEYGPASHRGQILRALGLPSRRTPQGEGRQLWEYDGARVSYLVVGDKVLETSRPAATAEGTGGR